MATVTSVPLADLLGTFTRSPDSLEAVKQTRDLLERTLARLVVDLAHPPLRLTKDRLNAVLDCERSVLALADRARELTGPQVLGLLVDRVVQQLVFHGPIAAASAYDLAVDALAAEGREDVLTWLGDGETWARANLEVHAANAVEMFGPIAADWWPRCERSVEVPLADGAVLATARFDVFLGGRRSNHAGLIIEVKSGGRVPAHLDDARFYALLGAMADDEPPAAVVTVWTADAKFAVEPVRPDSLHAAAVRVVAAAERLASLGMGRPATTRANPRCAWCPARPQCSAGQGWMSTGPGDLDDDNDVDLETDGGGW
jgi:hypothetical protein